MARYHSWENLVVFMSNRCSRSGLERLTYTSSGSIKSKFDATPSERDLLGHPFLPFSKQVKDTIKWYTHLKD